MIAATGLELRAGAQLLLEAATFQVSARGQDRPGRPERRRARPRWPGCWPARPARRRARCAAPARSATCRRTPGPATWTALAMDRVLSARGLDELLRRAARGRARRWPTPTRPAGTRPCAGTATLEERLSVLGGYAAEAEARRIASSLGLPDRVLAPAAAHAVRRAAAPGRAGPDPVRGRARRCCSTSRPTTWTPTPVSWLRDHLRAFRGGLVVISHDTGAARGGGQQGLPPGRRPLRAGHLQPGLDGLPGPAGDRRAAAPPGAGQRASARPPRCRRRPTRCGPRPPRPGPRRACSGGRSGCWPGSAPSSGTGAGGQDPVPGAGPLRPDPADRPGPVASPTARSRSSPTWTWPWTAAPGSWCWG